MNVSITASGASIGIAVAAGQVGTVLDQPATHGRPHRVQVETPLGAKSASEFAPNSGFTITASGRSDVGTRGEPQVIRMLVEHLAARGIHAEEVQPSDAREQAAWNANKVDARLRIGEEELDVQVTAVPGDPSHWHAASQGTSTVRGTIGDAVAMIRDAIERKIEVAPRRMLLAIDARHTAPVIELDVLTEYIRMYGDPTDLGFVAVVLVGPTTALSATIGSRVQ